MLRVSVVVLVLGLYGCGGEQPAAQAPSDLVARSDVEGSSDVRLQPDDTDIEDLLRAARRIPNSTRWFEIIALPNEVYALWEPGHADKVNAFLVAGRDKDMLYDTGLGIASIRTAVTELRAIESLDDKPLMVVNSHNHLDHNGGNTEFDEAWIMENDWAIAKLTEGVSGFATYWGELTPHPGVVVPADFDPETFSIPPFPEENIRFLRDGDVIDLGNRQFKVIHATAHSPDGVALYDAQNRIFFGGDTFLGDSFLIGDLGVLAQDLERISGLPIDWHYSSHGPQLIEAMGDGRRLAIVRRMLDGERSESTTVFAGNEFPLYELDGVKVTLAGDFLTY